MGIIKIEGLYKSFGKNEVIKNLNFSVPKNSIFGFIGENGAGKTTTMEMILGLLKPDRGRISVMGEPVTYGETKTNRFIGYLPDVPAFYKYMKPKEYLQLCGEITGMSQTDIKARSEELLSLVGLARVDKRIGSFSRGMKQRLGIAQALLNEPQILICDEPTSALDPKGRKEILDILEGVRDKTTVLFSTHILYDAERICDRIVVLHDGKAALAGTLQKIKSQYRQDSLLLEFKSPADKEIFMQVQELKPFLTDFKENNSELILYVDDITEIEPIIYDIFVENKVFPARFEVLEPTLENLFLEVVR